MSARLSAGALLLAVLAGAVARGQDPLPPVKVHGKIEGETTWSGRILVDGDVEVAGGARLRVAAGTEVLIAASDETGSGWKKNRVEIHVKGTLLVEGTEKAPVRFMPAEPVPAPRPDARSREWNERPWHGIVIWPEGLRHHVVRGAIFKSAYAALQLPSGELEVQGCVFEGCGMGIEAGRAHADSDRDGMLGGPAHPLVKGCRFSRCFAGVCIQGGAAVSLLGCVFQHCTFGTGNEAVGLTWSVTEPGSIADRCTFLDNETAVIGSAIVTNSVFSGNRRAATPTDHHAFYDSDDDHFVYAHNVFHDNGEVMHGEAILGPGNVFAAPRWSGSLDALEKDWPPLPDPVRLADDSPGRGRATDGGDVGALGAAGSAPVSGAGVWKPVGAAVGPLLALRADPKDAGDPAASARSILEKGAPAPGLKAAASWWVSPGPGVAGTIELRPLFGLHGGGWVAAVLETAAPGDAEVEINGDLGAVQAWWNGRPAPPTSWPRRFHVSGAILKVKAGKGRNVLLLWVASRGANPLLGIAASVVPEEARRAPEPAAAPKPLRALGARVLRAKDGTVTLEVNVSAPLNWIDDGRAGLVGLLDPDGRHLPGDATLPVQIIAAQALRVGPLPRGLPASLTVVLGALRDPTGAIYPNDPAPCKVSIPR